jgi:hypothetical protein
MKNSVQDFGCLECWQPDADLAFNAFRALKVDSYLIDESHYIVTIRHCLTCSQKFLSVFTEMVDYADGDDPQYRIVISITSDEAEKLNRSGDFISRKDLESIGIGRRSLHWDHPKGARERTYWGTGVQVQNHY